MSWVNLLIIAALAQAPEVEDVSPDETSESSSADEAATLELTVESRLDQNDELVENAIREDLVETLATHGLQVQDKGERALRVVVAWRDETHALPGYRVQIAYSTKPGGDLVRGDTFECECGAQTLASEIAKHVEALAPKIIADEDSPTLTSPPPPEPAESVPTDSAMVLSHRPSYGVWLWGSGLFLTAGGGATLAGMGAGLGVLAARDRDIKPGHYVTIGVAGAAVLAGIPMLIFGTKRIRSNVPVQASASVRDEGAMLHLSGRF